MQAKNFNRIKIIKRFLLRTNKNNSTTTAAVNKKVRNEVSRVVTGDAHELWNNDQILLLSCDYILTDTKINIKIAIHRQPNKLTANSM